MLGLFGQNKQSNDHSPSMTLSKVAYKMIKSLQGKLPKDTWHHCNYGLNDDPRPSLSHPNTRLSTKCDGGTKLLKGLKHSNNLWENLGVDNLLVTWIKLAKQNTCLFSNHTSLHFQKQMKTFQKTYTFVYIPTWIITKVATTLASFQNIFKPTHKAPFQTKQKWFSEQLRARR